MFIRAAYPSYLHGANLEGKYVYVTSYQAHELGITGFTIIPNDSDDSDFNQMIEGYFTKIDDESGDETSEEIRCC